jgi:ABC-2 type transport system ATP-binding protein
MIEARHLVKRYGSTVAVNDLSFSIRPGLVTGFLGPNGAGWTRCSAPCWSPVT